MNFEDFLENEFIKQYTGTDDEMEGRFNLWLEQLDKQELIDYADLYKDSFELSLTKQDE